MGFGVSNSLAYTNDRRSGSNVFYLFLFFMFVLMPTSTNGALPQLSRIIIDWAILSMAILICMRFYSQVNWNHMVIVILTLGFMMIVTLISNFYDPNGNFSLARLAPILCFLAMSLISIDTVIPIKLVKFTVHFFMSVFIIWNLLIISNNAAIQEFTIDNYTQLYESAVSNMFIKSRPVMSFGIYTFASYFYFIFFLVIRSLLKLTGKKIYLVYLILILIANIMLFSNTAFIFSLIMSYYIFSTFDNKHAKLLFVVFILLGGFYILSSFNFWEYYLESFYSKQNGFRGRYLESGTLNLNLDYLKDKFYIGFNIVKNITYTDSGYILYYTMGGPVLLLVMYYCFFKFSRNNFTPNYLLFFIPTMIFEIALPIMIYYKFIYASLFFALSYRSIQYQKELKNKN